jgi:hypothetical protein
MLFDHVIIRFLLQVVDLVVGCCDEQVPVSLPHGSSTIISLDRIACVTSLISDVIQQGYVSKTTPVLLLHKYSADLKGVHTFQRSREVGQDSLRTGKLGGGWISRSILPLFYQGSNSPLSGRNSNHDN